jgi:hypothetical protein
VVVLVPCRNWSLVDPLGFTSWLTSTPVSLALLYGQRKTTSWRTSPSFVCSPASSRPSSPQFSPPWQQSVPSFTPADDQPRFLLHFRDDNSKEFLHTNSRVSVLWPCKPRETNEVTLDRGEMLQILRTYDDKWAGGYRLGERAEE